MNNPNPFVPKGSLLEQQSQRRSRLKLAVFCVLAVSVTGLTAMLIQGCKREQPPVEPSPLDLPTNNIPLDNTNIYTPPTNTLPPLPPLPPTNPNPNPVPPLPPLTNTGDTGAGTEYIVQKGDNFSTLHKKFGVSVSAIAAANPGVDSTKLKIKQKLIIPAASKTTAGAAPLATTGGTADVAGETYTVKSGDTLEKLHKKFGVSVKAIQDANNLTTTKIKVGQKLKIPAKAVAAPAAPATVPAPPVDTAPPLPPLAPTTPAPAAPSAPTSH
jgi:LysM repeat protein